MNLQQPKGRTYNQQEYRYRAGTHRKKGSGQSHYVRVNDTRQNLATHCRGYLGVHRPMSARDLSTPSFSHTHV